ncbi:MAG: hypothetical protein HYR91_04190 [Flavobacteriia bacterium]|nr:hypothetical protein [Flavobacteriia bacterium]
MKTGKRTIANGVEFNSLFPKAEGKNLVIKNYAELSDTVSLMKKVITTTLSDTKQISKVLEKSTLEETCASVWEFCFNHLQYEKDEQNKEQVRRPARTWKDRQQGIDCDCMTVFIGSILMNLDIPFSIRLTKYQSSEFEHVYPVVHIGNKVIIMDCVVHKYNYEVPYTQKQDIKMDLQYLNGFEDDEFDEFEQLEGWEDDYNRDELEGLDGNQKKLDRKYNRQEKRKTRVAKYTNSTLKQKLGKGLHVVNRLNPATALLRAGVLASMKVNLMKVAGKLRYSYWTDAQAQQNNMDLAKFKQLKTIREKLEKIFYGAGGKPENLKKSILTGRGNRDKKVSLNGLGEVISPVYNEHDLIAIIGTDTYYDEFNQVQNKNGVNGLGSVTAGASIAAASGVIGTIATLIKKLGGLFKKGSKEEKDDEVQDKISDEEEKNSPHNSDEIANQVVTTQRSSNLPALKTTSVDTTADESGTDETESTDMESRSANTNAKSADAGGSGGFMQWVKDHPLLSLGIAGAVIGGTILAVKALKGKKAPPKSSKALNGLEGLDGVRRKTTKKPLKRKVTVKRKTTTKTPIKRKTTKQKPRRRKATTHAKSRGYVRRIELL